MDIKTAIKYYNQATAENTAAQQAAREAAENERTLYKSIPGSIFSPDRKTSPEYIAAKEASEKAEAAKKAARKTRAAAIAASENVLNAAANELIKAMQTSPELYTIPTHYKKFTANVEKITGERFYIKNSLDVCLYLYYKDGQPGHDSIFITGINKSIPEIDTEKDYTKPVLTLKEIKREVNQAIKDAEKLRAAADKFKKLEADTKAKYISYVSYLLPSAEYNILKDEYNLF